MNQTNLSSRQRILLFLAVAAAALLAAHLLDHWTYLYIAYYHAGRYTTVDGMDWARFLRSLGYLPLWLAGALALCLNAWPRIQKEDWRVVMRPAYLLALTPTIAGALDELTKLVVRRERPNAHAGAYVFRPFTDHPFSSSGLGFPSSHAAVAFGAAFILCRLWPRAWPVWIILAVGCALTRILDRAHFLSDVTGGLLVAYATTWALWHATSPRDPIS